MLRQQVVRAAFGGARNSFQFGVPTTTLYVNQTRTAVSLKELKNRMTTIVSIKKITNSMNKLATSKLRKARDDMEQIAKPLLEVTDGFLGRSLASTEDVVPNGKEIVLLVTTDRGMCGATNSGLVRLTKKLVNDYRKTAEFQFVISGNKGTSVMRRDYSKQFVTTVGEITKKKTSFADVEPLVTGLNSVPEYDRVRLITNSWVSVVSTEIQQKTLPHPDKIIEEMKDHFFDYEYEEADSEELFKNLQEHLVGSYIYGSVIENNACELAARMNSMDNATTNAGEMHQKLGLLYNRTRQANITTELSEIISGAAAVMEAS